MCKLHYYDPNIGTIYGNIGMGLDGYGINNYLDEEPKFSIDLDEGGLTGQLVFDCDTTKMNSSGYTKTSKSSKNWEIQSETMLAIESLAVAFHGKVIFDLNTPEIGLPEHMYLGILAYLNSTYNLTCYDPTLSLLGCVYHGNYLNLPPISIGDEIMIPPQVYLHPLDDNVYDLMIVVLTTSNSSDLPNIQITEKYKDHVILGAPFLQHFYVCFEGRLRTDPNFNTRKGSERC